MLVWVAVFVVVGLVILVWRPVEFVTDDPQVRGQIKLLSDTSILPRRAYNGDAGVDLVVSESVTCEPGKFTDVPTGVAVALPPEVWARIVGRSSTIRRRGLLVVEGIIDNGFRGELFVGVFNPGTTPILAARGERLGQLIMAPIVSAEWDQVDELPPSERGTKGFGSSGV